MPVTHDGTCGFCGDEYEGGRSPNYCQWACYVASKWTIRACERCEKVFAARRVYVERGQYRFCSSECAQVASRSDEGIMWRGERFTVNAGGYYASTSDRSLLHRRKWEEANGEIPKGVVCHHVNGNKTDNRLENLELMEWGEHTAHHNATGVTTGEFVCRGCGEEVQRRMSDIRRGQNKYCSRDCSNRHRPRREDGTYV